eukprot:TRINITY_DN15422_c0_g2_i1.p1 TRINITY_DN15422_c0_g2~~TRINITY_DN15422_c0_g2_i1.p1  ORF type:complete len:381 (-),score=34.25 TRINITY_DN15422_c0_g2_i1:185-1327(-)
MQQSYATMDQPRFATRSKWENRGRTLGLFLDAAITYGYYFVVLVSLTLAVRIGKSKLMPCSAETSASLSGLTSQYVCEYSKAFIMSFPCIAVATFVLLLGRDILQKRLYYAFLKVGGVIKFSCTNPLKDLFIIMLGVNYLHCIIYVAMTSNLAQLLLKLGQAVSSTKQQVAIQLHFIIMAVTVLVPTGLMSAFLYNTYPIHSRLVPLSAYLEEDDSDNALTLTVLEESKLRRLVESDDSGLLTQLRTVSGRYSRCDIMLTEYNKQAARKSTEVHDSDGYCSRGLAASLWPAQFIINDPGKNRRFCMLWYSWVCFSIACLVHEMEHMIEMIMPAVSGLFHGHGIQAVVLGVCATHLVFVGVALRTTVLSVWISCPDTSELI